MDTSQTASTPAGSTKAARLPAGSMMVLPNGISVPHPHAEANAPGAGDTRLAGTDAVVEGFEDAARAQQVIQATPGQ